MTRKVRLALSAILLISLLVSSSCDSDQPLSVEGQQVDIYFNAFSSVVPLYRVWDLTKDTDQNGIPDDVNGDGVSDSNDITLWCEWDLSTTTPNSVPWNYSLRISVLRAGEAEPEILTSDVAATLTGNKAPYDDRVDAGVANPSAITLNMATGTCSNNPLRFCNPAGSAATNCPNGGTCVGMSICSLNPSTTCNPNQQTPVCSANGFGMCTPAGVCSGNAGVGCFPGSCADTGQGVCQTVSANQRFLFNNSTRSSLSAASLKVLRAGRNTLGNLCTGDAACAASLQTLVGGAQTLAFPLGECPGDPAGMLGTPVTDPITQDLNPDTTIFGLDLKKGDTLLVEARLSDQIPGSNGIIPFLATAGLETIIMVDGTKLQPTEVVGTLNSTDPDGPAITFSFTSQ